MKSDTKKRKRLVASLAGAFVVACLAGAGAFAFAGRVPADDVMRIEGMVSNLSGGGMVKLSLTVVMEHGTSGEGAEDRARAYMIERLRGTTKADLDGVKGLEGLKAAATEGLGEATGGAVKEVLIREFVVNG